MRVLFCERIICFTRLTHLNKYLRYFIGWRNIALNFFSLHWLKVIFFYIGSRCVCMCGVYTYVNTVTVYEWAKSVTHYLNISIKISSSPGYSLYLFSAFLFFGLQNEDSKKISRETKNGSRHAEFKQKVREREAQYRKTLRKTMFYCKNEKKLKRKNE